MTTESAALPDLLAAYVPARVARRLAGAAGAPTEPAGERFAAAVLFADVVGFTALAERLAERGAAGAEELSRLLGAYFGQIVELVADHGGDVVRFAGDAPIVLWPAGD